MFDLWGAGKRYLDADRFERPLMIQKSFLPSSADAMILEDKSYHRVLNLSVSTFNDNSPTSWFHKSIGGYHGAKLKRYQELIDSSIVRELSLFQAMADKATSIEDLQPVFNFTPVLNMLNAKYVIYNPEAPPLINPKAMGNAWFVGNSAIVDGANQELAALKTIDPLKEAVIDIKFNDQVSEATYQLAPGDTIELISYKPDELMYKYTAEGERLAVFSEVYYPAGWKCFIDGNESNYFRTDYVLRGMIVPAGSHQIRFIFEPASYYMGNKVSLASSVLLILLAAGYFVLAYIKKTKSIVNDQP